MIEGEKMLAKPYINERGIESILPCTRWQEHHLRLAEKIKDSARSVARWTFELEPHINSSQLQTAWQAVAKVHPPFRTSIVNDTISNSFRQVIYKEALPWGFSTFHETASSDILGEGEWEFCIQPVQVNIRKRYATTQLVVQIHHAICDPRVAELIFRQVKGAYSGANLTHELPFSFTPFVRISESATDQRKEEHPNLDTTIFPSLPFSKYEPAATASITRCVRGLLPSTVSNLDESVWLTWAILQSQYQNSNSVVYGVPVARQNSGCPAALVPKHIVLDEQATVQAMLKHLHGVSTASGEMGVIGIQMKDEPTFFHTVLSVRSINDDPFIGKLLGSANQNPFHNYALALDLQLDKNSITVQADYDSTVIPQSQMQRILDHFAHLLLQVNVRPTSTISDLKTVSKQDHAQLLFWNQNLPSYSDECFHNVVGKWCVDQPHAQAVASWDGTFTYIEVDRISDQIAIQLVREGVQLETIVPICLEKSRWTTPAILGVMKAGGAFVLFDPSYPVQRLRYMCEAVNCPLILSSKNTENVVSQLRSRVVIFEDLLGKNTGETQLHSLPQVRSDNALYVAFTSGSTGNPKAVVVDHQSYITGARSHVRAFQLQPDSRVLQFASYGFDVSILETLCALISGGCLCIPNDSERTDSYAFIQALSSLKVTHTLLTPSFARSVSLQDVKSLRVLILGGEQMSLMDAASWSDFAQVMNAYGPAEASANATVQTNISHDINNIGYPTGCVLWVTDPSDISRLVPIGGVGELVIEGPIVGRGYLNVSTTGTAFVEPPSWLKSIRSGSESRLYRTGDLVRQNEDGSLLFIGRKDAQVKIRGQRVELGEIEYQVEKNFDGYCEVAVCAVSMRWGPQPTLVAFICLDNSPKTLDNSAIFLEPNTELLVRFESVKTRLKGHLPVYMIPAVFIPATRIPKTGTDKVDRKYLQQQAAGLCREQLDLYIRGHGDGGSSETRTEREEKLQRLFACVLGLRQEEIGLHDNFFEIGGDSIMAIKLVAIAREAGLIFSASQLFNHPKLSELSEVTSEQTESGQDLQTLTPFSLIRNNENQQSVILAAQEQYPVPQSDIEDIYPSTSLQEGMFALSIKERGMYVGRIQLDLAFDIDMERLQAAWQATVDANPILRTRFIQTVSALYQVVIRGTIAWETGGELDKAHASTIEPNDFIGGNLLRFVATTPCADGKSHLVLILHHALCDGWSLPLILEQVQRAYHGNELEYRPFSPFIQHVTAIQGAEDFWTSELAGLDAPVFPVLPDKTYIPKPKASCERRIGNIEKGSLKTRTAVLIQLAWAILVSHYTDCSDVVFGLTTTGRKAAVPGIEQMTGPTIATGPMPVQFKPGETVFDAVRGLEKKLTSMIDYEQVGLQNIAKMSPQAASACCFQTQLGIQPPSQMLGNDLFGVSETTLTELMDYSAFSSYAIVLVFSLISGTEMGLKMNYDPAIVTDPEAKRITEQFECVLRQLFKSTAEQELSKIRVISPQDMQQISKWNSTLPAPTNRCLHELILARCNESPNATALASWDGTLTYEELDSASAQLASILTDSGITIGSLVPICVDRSKWGVAIMLAVLRAGGTCVLLDAAHPHNRKQDIIEQTEATVMIATPVTEDKVKGLTGNLIVVSPIMMESSSPSSAASLCSSSPSSFLATNESVTPQHAAFIIFTSGSTGKPKGIIMPHSSLCTSIHHHSPGFGLHSECRVLHFCSYAFDASIYEIFTTLSAGACLCIPSEFDRMNGIANFIRREEVNYAILAPSSLSLFSPQDVPSLKTLVLGGEAMTREIVDNWAGKLTLINGYGPAETTICASGRVPAVGWKSGVIGHVVGAVPWITSPSDPSRLSFIGAVGELLLEGPVLADGYLKEPEKTAAVFIPRPSWMDTFRPKTDDVRLYRTGDLVQYEADGSIRFAGRRDTQIKLRGQRVELGEVETRLVHSFGGDVEAIAEVVKLPALNDAAALVAFVLLDQAESPQQSDAILHPPGADFHGLVGRAIPYLSQSLPSYMVPSIYFPVLKILRTISGKTDRKLLRGVVENMSVQDLDAYRAVVGEKRAISTSREAELQSIWARILQVPEERIGAQDDFFRLGGDSIDAMKMAAMARGTDIQITVPDVFSNPELWSLAALTLSQDSIRGEIPKNSQHTPSNVSLLDREDSKLLLARLQEKRFISPDSRLDDIRPATGAQLFLIERYPWTHFRFSLQGDVSVSQLRHACDVVMERHSILRTLFTKLESNDNDFVQVILENPDVPFHHITTIEDLTQHADSLCNADLATSVGEVGLPLAFTLISDPSTKQHIFLVRMSHAQYDGVSIPVLFHDIAAAYNGCILAPSMSFASYLNSTCQQSNTDDYQFWRDLLAGSSSLTTLPRPQTPTRQECHPISATRSIPPFTPFKGITLATYVKAATALMLAQLTQSTDLIFGQTVDGRSLPIPDIDRILGPCVNYIPMRVKLQSQWTALDLLQHVQQEHARTIRYDYLDMYDVIRKCTNWATGDGSTPYYGVFVQHQNIETGLELPLDNVECSFSASGKLYPQNEIWISCTPSCEELRVRIDASSRILSAESADDMAQILCTTIQQLSRFPEKDVLVS